MLNLVLSANVLVYEFVKIEFCFYKNIQIYESEFLAKLKLFLEEVLFKNSIGIFMYE